MTAEIFTFPSMQPAELPAPVRPPLETFHTPIADAHHAAVRTGVESIAALCGVEVEVLPVMHDGYPLADLHDGSNTFMPGSGGVADFSNAGKHLAKHAHRPASEGVALALELYGAFFAAKNLIPLQVEQTDANSQVFNDLVAETASRSTRPPEELEQVVTSRMAALIGVMTVVGGRYDKNLNGATLRGAQRGRIPTFNQPTQQVFSQSLHPKISRTLLPGTKQIFVV